MKCKILFIQNDDYFSLLFIPINCCLGIQHCFLINTCNIISISRRLIYLSHKFHFLCQQSNDRLSRSKLKMIRSETSIDCLFQVLRLLWNCLGVGSMTFRLSHKKIIIEQTSLACSRQGQMNSC